MKYQVLILCAKSRCMKCDAPGAGIADKNSKWMYAWSADRIICESLTAHRSQIYTTRIRKDT